MIPGECDIFFSQKNSEMCYLAAMPNNNHNNHNYNNHNNIILNIEYLHSIRVRNNTSRAKHFLLPQTRACQRVKAYLVWPPKTERQGRLSIAKIT